VKSTMDAQVRIKMVTTRLDMDAIEELAGAWRSVSAAHARLARDARDVASAMEAVQRVMDRLPFAEMATVEFEGKKVSRGEGDPPR